MKAVVQRVNEASVSVDGEKISEISRGLLVLLGLEKSDSEDEVRNMAARLVKQRFFEDEAGKMNLSLADVGGQVLAVSQFTLAADLSRGLRPSFDSAMPPDVAKKLFEFFVSSLREKGVQVQEGVFGAHMHVKLVNDGPVTFVLEGAMK